MCRRFGIANTGLCNANFQSTAEELVSSRVFQEVRKVSVDCGGAVKAPVPVAPVFKAAAPVPVVKVGGLLQKAGRVEGPNGAPKTSAVPIMPLTNQTACFAAARSRTIARWASR